MDDEAVGIVRQFGHDLVEPGLVDAGRDVRKNAQRFAAGLAAVTVAGASERVSSSADLKLGLELLERLLGLLHGDDRRA